MADRPNRRKGRKKVCAFCVDKIENIDYKDIARLRRYMSERGKILPRRVTGSSVLVRLLFFLIQQTDLRETASAVFSFAAFFWRAPLRLFLSGSRAAIIVVSRKSDTAARLFSL